MTENSIKKLDFYKNGKIYRIVCNETGLQYIGSTCKTLKQRLQQHKSSYKAYNDGKVNYITSFKILENNNYDIVLIEDFPCERKEQLNARERFYIDSLTCVNKNSPNKFNELGKVKYAKEYYNDNKDKILDQKMIYYNDNKDKILNYQKEYREDNKDKILNYQKEYREDNKEKFLDYQKEYREDNKEYYKQYKNQNIPCLHCGCTYTRSNKLKHNATKKHKRNSLKDDESTISDITI